MSVKVTTKLHPRCSDQYRYSHFQKLQEFALDGGVDFNTDQNHHLSCRRSIAFAINCSISV